MRNPVVGHRYNGEEGKEEMRGEMGLHDSLGFH